MKKLYCGCAWRFVGPIVTPRPFSFFFLFLCNQAVGRHDFGLNT